MANIIPGVVSSAGSKVMLTGGYLVLHRPNNGLVLGVDARLHTGIYPLLPFGKDTMTFNGIAVGRKSYQDGVETYPIVILTPQLCTEPLYLNLVIKPAPITQLTQPTQPESVSPYEFELIGDYEKNSFASKSIHYSLIAISSLLTPTDFISHLSRGFLLDIRGDRSFYSSQPVPNQNITPSQSLTLDGAVVQTETDYNDSSADYKTKTGLGSSAAVVSSLVTALFSHFNLLPSRPEDVGDEKIKTYAYRVAQVAHCIAQGKVGSGFDVATAFFGTQTYCRFSSRLLTDLMTNPLENSSESYQIGLRAVSDDPTVVSEMETQPKADKADKANPYSTAQGNAVFLSVLAAEWDDNVDTFTLPPHLNIILADVQGGSETPGMVKKVEDWKNNGGERAAELWKELAKSNRTIEKHFKTLNEIATKNHTAWVEVLNLCGDVPAEKWSEVQVKVQGDDHKVEIVTKLIELVTDFSTTREHLREMGKASGVEIEPESQKELINATCQQNGVVFGGVPGAGGFDAVFAVIIQTPDNAEAIKANIIATWANLSSLTAESNSIFCLPVGIDQNGGVRTRVAYKNVEKWDPKLL